MLNRLRNLSIIARSVWITFRYSCYALYVTTFKKAEARRIVDDLTRNWSQALLDVIALNYQVENPHQVDFAPGKPYIIMSNHASLYDIPLIFVALPKNSIRMLAKKELFRVPIWGQAMRRSEFISIDRDNREQAIKDLAFTREKMTTGLIPWIAPEGSRSRTGELQRFKKGGFMLAIETQATIIPVAICGSYDILPAGQTKIHKGTQTTIKIGEPVDASQFSLQQRQQLSDLVHERIENLLNSQDSRDESH